jgi:Uma2 family endonuclease
VSLAQKIIPDISEHDYLEGELISDIKHEYIAGNVYAMAGASKNHERVLGNVFADIKNHVKINKLTCDVFASDIKVKVENIGINYFYPDIMVSCDTEDNDSEYYINSPIIIVEVLSKSTRKNDLTTKKTAYLNIPSLQEYIIIEQDFCEVEVFRKNEYWNSTRYFLGDNITFNSIDITISVEDIYYQVKNEDIYSFLREKEIISKE